MSGPGELHPPEGPWAAEGVVTRARQTSWPYVPTAFVDAPVGRTLTAVDLLGAAAKLGADRLMVCGDPDVFAQPGAASRVESVSMLGGQNPSTPKGHHTGDPAHPIFRFRTPTGAVEVMRAGGWFGEDVTADVARQAWLQLGLLLRAAFRGARLLSTPGTTGRDLWLRTIPAGRSYPVLSAGMREFLRRTTTQGRNEWRGTELAGMTVDLTVWDARWAYAGLLANLPDPASTTVLSEGAVQTMPADTLSGHLRGRGRWRVRFTPPGWWDRAGLLPAARPVTDARPVLWEWPTGGTHTTWADSCEVDLARRAGWHVTVLEGVVWGEAKVAETWVKRLDTIRQHVSDGPVGRAIAAAIRAMVIQTIGGWASRSHPVTRVGTPAQAPDDAGELREAGPGLVTWQEPGSTPWGDSLRHPEWAHTVWARARRALLSTTDADGKAAGALHLPPGCFLLGVRTDALYLAGPAPTWTDDGRTGRLRLKPDQSGRFTIGATPWRLTP
jgi:hypothetical protein